MGRSRLGSCGLELLRRKLGRRILTSGLLLIAGLAVTTQLDVAPASARTGSPTAYSFYVEVGNNYYGDIRMETLGCNQAISQRANNYNSYVILDFGGLINSAGAQETINGILLTQSDVATLAEWYVNGYKGCGPSHLNNLAVGTNNSITLTQAEGAAFGHTVNLVSGFVRAYSPYQRVDGANDIESFCPGDCQSSSSTYAWYTGYASTATTPYADYGSADGCPLSLGYTCLGGWNQGDYYNLCRALALAQCVPEIYFGPSSNSLGINAEQWEYVSEFGAPNSEGH